MKLKICLGLAAVACLASASVMAQTSTRGDGSAPAGVNLITAEEVTALFAEGGLRGGGAVIRVDETAFEAGSGLITFSEFSLGTTNPTYTPADYGGVAANPDVSFGGFFQGQSLGDAGSCPVGAALTGCVVGSPTDPLTLDPSSPSTSIVSDGANPTSPVLSGSPLFNGPVAILFDEDIAGVGLDGGFFDDVNSTSITAFSRSGQVIGSVLNDGTGIEFLGLVTASGNNEIAGLLFSLAGAENAGFAIDNLRFGDAAVIGGPQDPIEFRAVPLLNPWSIALLSLVLLSLGLLVVRRLG
jgi:hypothetical protein